MNFCVFTFNSECNVEIYGPYRTYNKALLIEKKLADKEEDYQRKKGSCFREGNAIYENRAKSHLIVSFETKRMKKK